MSDSRSCASSSIGSEAFEFAKIGGETADDVHLHKFLKSLDEWDEWLSCLRWFCEITLFDCLLVGCEVQCVISISCCELGSLTCHKWDMIESFWICLIYALASDMPMICWVANRVLSTMAILYESLTCLIIHLVIFPEIRRVYLSPIVVSFWIHLKGSFQQKKKNNIKL